jgi:hypothetical protein
LTISEFPVSVIEEIGYYVYLLIDPDTNQVFYVGKGTGNRVFSHVNAAISNPLESDKIKKILGIRSKGQDVKYEILRHGLTEKEAFEVEAAIIDFIGLPELTNLVSGFDTFGRGRMNASDIVAKYQAPILEIKEPVILIIVNRLYERNISPERLYEITRWDWVVGIRRERAKYAMSVYNGIVREVYRINHWFPVNTGIDTQINQKRWRFEGEVSKELQKYVGGSVENYITHGAQNPIKYVNC